MVEIGCPETSVLNQPTLRNNSEDEEISNSIQSKTSELLLHKLQIDK
jgi:hypothetical protein